MHARSICVQCVDIAIGELLFWNAIRGATSTSKFRLTCYIICGDDLTLVHNVSSHMLRYGTASKRVNRILIQGKGLIPAQTHYLNPNLQIRTMATQNKSESEWKAVLSPEQVSSICISRN